MVINNNYKIRIDKKHVKFLIIGSVHFIYLIRICVVVDYDDGYFKLTQCISIQLCEYLGNNDDAMILPCGIIRHQMSSKHMLIYSAYREICIL